MTFRRAAYRWRYMRVMSSVAWRERRREWLVEHEHRTESPPVCTCCARPWILRDDLHHLNYERLGNERYEDLEPMCRACHEALHRILDGSRQWRAMPLPTATASIISRLTNGRTRGTHYQRRTATDRPSEAVED